MRILISEATTSKVIGYHGSPHDFNSFSNETLGKGIDLLGPGFYFFQTPQYAENHSKGGYLYKCEINLSKQLNRHKETWKTGHADKMLQWAKRRMSKEQWGYLLSDWDETPRVAYNELIKSILSDDNDVDISLTLCYDGFKYEKPQCYQDFAYAMRYVLGYNGFIDDRKFDIPCVVVYDQSDISIIEKIKV